MAKKRANGEGNIRKRADGRWEGRYTAGYHPETGKRIIKNVLGKTQAECKAKLRPIASDRVKGSLSGWGWSKLMVRLPCGSPSISSTFFPACASPIPRLAQVVVLPTPPFWLAMAIICVFNDFTSFLIGVVMCLHSSPGNDKSRHLKQVTASPKSNILLCLKSKGFEFLSAIHLSLMKHLL